ncbi:MAG: phosphodiester glycosidase family protein, partial [Bacteroidia bacterium]|nr:phosphodiester glycosidase family protein [Bacteroidia bacterium]
PQPVPSATFPSGGAQISAQTAIGGGPVLLKNGEVKNYYGKELLDISADSSQPRSAIGIRKDKKMIFFVCEGRKMTPDVSGFTTAEVADILKDLGCVDAMNLDGGGSSCLLINGKETIKGSDGKQRSVVTAVALK